MKGLLIYFGSRPGGDDKGKLFILKAKQSFSSTHYHHHHQESFRCSIQEKVSDGRSYLLVSCKVIKIILWKYGNLQNEGLSVAAVVFVLLLRGKEKVAKVN
jgi:predicted NAD/FAD-dependent oxidoreductase